MRLSLAILANEIVAVGVVSLRGRLEHDSRVHGYFPRLSLWLIIIVHVVYKLDCLSDHQSQKLCSLSIFLSLSPLSLSFF